MRFGVSALAFMLLFGNEIAAAATDSDTVCRPYFGDACSEAMGHWLPRVPNGWIVADAAPSPARTSVYDEILDPAGTGRREFLKQQNVYRGSFFAYGKAGPPQGHAVYDPIHRIAYYDEGCCSWHHVVVATNVSPPPKRIAMRSLIGLKIRGGIKLGDPPAEIESIYGPSRLHSVKNDSTSQTLSYVRALASGSMTCYENTTFLFRRGRLAAFDFTQAC